MTKNHKGPAFARAVMAHSHMNFWPFHDLLNVDERKIVHLKRNCKGGDRMNTSQRDQYGGWTELKFEATGFFRLEKSTGRTLQIRFCLSSAVYKSFLGLLRRPRKRYN